MVDNMDDSDKLALLITIKPEKPHCFMNMKVILCNYTYNKKGRMISTIFKEFLWTLMQKQWLGIEM